MEYKNIKPAKFISRPNRFIANILIDGKTEICHVKNTGRCRELLVPDAEVFVQQFNNSNRKTKFDLICVVKDKKLINMDSQVPNKVFAQWVIKSGYFGSISKLKPECFFENSRFDFYIETEDHRKIFVEIKGVTLEEYGVSAFPDAPTQRGVKHLNELCKCIDSGYEAYVFFIIQMKDVHLFVPNRRTHSEFADALIKANDYGVKIHALNCFVTPDTIEALDFIKINLKGGGYFE